MERWLISFMCICSSFGLNRQTIDSSLAVCNDHSPAKYYDRRNNSSTKWVIFLESGGGCSTRSDCLKRYNTSTILMSSKWLDDFQDISGRDLLSIQKKYNPFYMYNHVYVPYCSSDMYTGLIKWNSSMVFSEDDKNFIFAGSYIIESLFDDLIRRYGVENFTEIIFSGSSAGGIGVMNHIQTMRDRFTHAQSNIKGIIDSSWFLNFEDNFLIYWHDKPAQEMTGYKGMSHGGRKLCEKESGGIPCCFQAGCMEHYSQFDNTEVFFIVSKNDIYLLKASLIRSLDGMLTTGKFSSLLLSQIADIASAYSGAMLLSINATKNTQNNSHSFFVTSCLQHVYVACSSLWEGDGPLHVLDVKGYQMYSQMSESMGIQLPINYSQFIEPRKLSKVFVRSYGKETSLLSSLEAWKRGVKQDLRDTCIGIDCNPTCPEQLDFVYSVDAWSKEINVIAMCILGFITAICCLVKIILSIQLIFFKRAQITLLDRGDLMVSISSIPELTVNDMLSVACLNLTYDVTVEVTKEQDDGKYQKLENTSENDVEQPKVRDRSRMTSMSVKKKTEVKNILKDINVYFNPGSLVGIMGPSGSGKTTFLDILTGRRWIKPEQRKNIYIDGKELHEMHDHYRSVSAYVLQLERPYYEELTVRENLTLEALMRLSANVPWETIFHRVETVLEETRLIDYADTVVGGDTGGGLSGGQKRKLCVALQLLVYPHIIFLDEPTSGLDSHSANELLTLLAQLTMSKRVVVTTIHQPRSEIFHMFTHILLLVEGRVAYYGSPLKAPDIFIKAINLSERTVDIEALKASNKADLIMDLLKDETAQKIILDYYKKKEEQNVVNGINRMKSTPSLPGTHNSVKYTNKNGGLLRTLLALESRSSMRETMFSTFYLPVIFTLVPVILGYVYFQADSPLLLISVYCVVTCMGPLFMTSIILNLITSTLRVFLMQYKDGVGYMYQVVIVVYTRMVAITTFPITLCSIIIYFLVNIEYDFWTLIQVTLLLLALCQAWIGVFTSVVYSGPTIAMRICPMVAALSAFTSGFLVPEPNMPVPFWILFFINPTFWGMQAICKLLLEDRMFACGENDSQLSCQASSGNFLLMTFGFLDGSPVTTAFVLVAVIVLTQVYSVFILLHKYSPEPIDKSFRKMCSDLVARSKSRVAPLITKGSKKETCTVHDKGTKTTNVAWAKVVKKVLDDQNELDNVGDADEMESQSEFMDGSVGHDVFKRGTIAEKRFMKNNEKVNKELGVTPALLNQVLSAMQDVSHLGESRDNHTRLQDRKKSSMINGITKEDLQHKRKAKEMTCSLLLDARRRAWQTSNTVPEGGSSGLWKSAGLKVVKKNQTIKRPENSDIPENSAEDEEDKTTGADNSEYEVANIEKDQNPEVLSSAEKEDKNDKDSSSASSSPGDDDKSNKTQKSDKISENGPTLVLDVLGDRHDGGLSSHDESVDSNV